MGVFCRVGRWNWTDVGEWAGETEGGEDWTGELVYLLSVGD